MNLDIRPETAADHGAIREVTRRAFAGQSYGGGNEQDIVDALRAEGALAISLVAEAERRILGHVAFSPATAADGTPGWYTLGPVSVDPDVQRRGIGRALIEAGLAALRQRHAAGCIVVGDYGYYARFGFRHAPAHAPPGAPASHFMILGLGPSAPSGVIEFHAAFGADGSALP